MREGVSCMRYAEEDQREKEGCGSRPREGRLDDASLALAVHQETIGN